MKTILLQNGHEMYEEAFQEKFTYILNSLREKGCIITDFILPSSNDNSLAADFTLLIEDYDDMKVRDCVANYYVEYSVDEIPSFEGDTILHFKFK